MLLQLCFHQQGITREECGELSASFMGPDGADPVVVTWESSVADMWELENGAIDWSQPRDTMFVPIRQGPDEYISDYPQLNGGNLWAGENPDDWYPMVLRFTSVVVSPGAVFSGWDAYIDGPDGGAGGTGGSAAGGAGTGGPATGGSGGNEPFDAGVGPSTGTAATDDGGTCGCRTVGRAPSNDRQAAQLPWAVTLVGLGALRRRVRGLRHLASPCGRSVRRRGHVRLRW
jgi:hypothetical protein